MADSLLCQVGKACLSGDEVAYPGSTFFIDPDGMNSWQLFFVFCVYGYVLFVSADMIGDGAELLLLVPGYDKMVGSIVLPILGAIPDGMMVLFSGVGPLVVAQENVAVGVGALAGSTIMLLTLPWILSIFSGRVDEEGGQCTGYKKKAGKKLTEGAGFISGAVCFEDGVTKNAWLMFITSLSYFVIQIPAYMVDDQKSKHEYPSEKEYLKAVVSESASENQYALLGVFVTLFFFAFYLYLQYLAAMEKSPPLKCMESLLPPAQQAPLDLVKKYGVLPKILHYRDNFQRTGKMRLTPQEMSAPYADAGQAPVDLPTDLYLPLKDLFNEYARKTNADGMNCAHMREIFNTIGINYTPEDLKKKFEKSDKDHSGFIDKTEFYQLFYDMVKDTEEELPCGNVDNTEEGDGDDDDDEEDEMPEEFRNLPPEEQTKAVIKLSFRQMLVGTLLVLIFTDPMVDVLAQIGKETGIPAFYVSFVLAPLASNASELLSSMKLAAKKSPGSITQSLQTLEGAACMNNTFCLGIFYILIWYQGLAWKFTAETLVIFFVQVLIFILVIKSNTQTMKEALIIFGCYPLSLVFVSLLESMGFD